MVSDRGGERGTAERVKGKGSRVRGKGEEGNRGRGDVGQSGQGRMFLPFPPYPFPSSP
jgi:hypothetical protein